MCTSTNRCSILSRDAIQFRRTKSIHPQANDLEIDEFGTPKTKKIKTNKQTKRFALQSEMERKAISLAIHCREVDIILTDLDVSAVIYTRTLRNRSR